MSRIKNAYAIAKKDLRRCYSKQGIAAGLRHFNDYWARDSLFACLGALALEDLDIVKKNLTLLSDYQDKDGQLPLRVGDHFIGLKLLGIRLKHKTRARYTQDKMFSRPTDQNSLFIIIFNEYMKKTKDHAFLNAHFPNLKKAIQWNINNSGKDFLMQEKHFASWADSIRKSGKVLYTNVLHCEAMHAFSMLCKLAHKTNDAKKYSDLHKTVKQKLNELFWKGQYYIDWTDKKEYDYFSTDGNILAILFNIANKKQALKIQQSIKKFRINKPIPSKTNFPKYPWNKLSVIDALVGIGDYHNGMSWLWLGCLDAVAKNKKIGLKKEAKQLLEKIAAIITRHNGVYEVYEQDGNPVNRWFYKSEHPFAWSSGLFVYAVHELKIKI